MAVLVEAYSVIIKRESIVSKFKGGWDSFLQSVPNNTMCDDGELIRIGFMDANDAEAYCVELELLGLSFSHDGFKDVAQVDQEKGVMSPCDWLKFTEIKLEDHEPGLVHVCILKSPMEQALGDDVLILRGDPPRISLALPANWNYEHSLSKGGKKVSPETFLQKYKHLRSEGDVQVYLDLETNKEVYMGRTG